MFISDESCSLGFPGLFGNGRAGWRMVERESLDPWYHVTFRLIVGNESHTKKLMPTDASSLSDLLALQSPTCLVGEVQVVTAPSLNGSPSERMEKLIRLLIGNDMRGECVMLHQVEGGEIYSSFDGLTDAALLRDSRIIYEATDTQSPDQECVDH